METVLMSINPRLLLSGIPPFKNDKYTYSSVFMRARILVLFFVTRLQVAFVLHVIQKLLRNCEFLTAGRSFYNGHAFQNHHHPKTHSVE